MAFIKAQRERVSLKIAITGPSGSGKTYSALRLAMGIGGRIAVIDTENDSASLYADLGDYDVQTIHAPFTVQKYTDAIREAVDGGYNVLVIDSLTHVWAADGGLLSQKEAKDARGGNSYTNWAEITKQHERLKSDLLQSPIHIIGTMRSKQDYVIEQTNGKSTPRKVGLAPVQREGLEYEFTVVFDIDMGHTSATSKDRTGLFTDEVSQITEAHGKRINEWLAKGNAPVQRQQEQPAAPQAQRPALNPPPPPRGESIADEQKRTAGERAKAPRESTADQVERSKMLNGIYRTMGNQGAEAATRATTFLRTEGFTGPNVVATIKAMPIEDVIRLVAKLEAMPDYGTAQVSDVTDNEAFEMMIDPGSEDGGDSDPFAVDGDGRMKN